MNTRWRIFILRTLLTYYNLSKKLYFRLSLYLESRFLLLKSIFKIIYSWICIYFIDGTCFILKISIFYIEISLSILKLFYFWLKFWYLIINLRYFTAHYIIITFEHTLASFKLGHKTQVSVFSFIFLKF